MLDLYRLKTSGTLLESRYSLIDKIGGGGFSEVWLAHDTKAQVDVAIKVYAAPHDLNDEGIAMFRKEFALVCNLSHSNILKPFTFDIIDGSPYIVLPYCAEGSASKLKGKASEEELWDFTKQVAAGLAHLHSHQIIHQDIKPANVLINADNQYMITDFGISVGLRNTIRRSMKDELFEGSGTTAYMSHECMDTKPINVIARDIWALGATLYELATGDVPFGEFGGNTQKANGGDVPRIGRGFSEEFEYLVRWCLALESWNRPSATEILEYCNNPFKRQKASPKKWLKTITLGGVAAAIIICIFMIWPKDETPPSAAINPNDSILLAKNDEAQSLVSLEESKSEIVERNVSNLCKAARIHEEAINLDATDSVIEMVREKWVASQEVIDETYSMLCVKTSEYKEIGAKNAEEQFGRKRDSLEQFVSNK